MGGVAGTWAPLGGLLVLVRGVGWGALVAPFALTAGLPLVGSPSCCANSPSGLWETPPLSPHTTHSLSLPTRA